MSDEDTTAEAATQPDLDRWAAEAAQVQRGVGLFRIRDRGLVAIGGADRVRWLDGMLTNDVTQLVPGEERSGCYALLLTHQGRIVGDIRVAVREDAFWLEMSAQAVPAVIACLDKHIIADDVEITDLGSATEWLGVEGPNSSELIGELVGRQMRLEPDAMIDVDIGGTPLALGRWGTSVWDGYRLLIPAGHTESVAAAVCAVGTDFGLVEATTETLEILRIEAGTPRFGAELDETVLPAEARLDRAISQTKGCYIGQEVVARMASRGRSSHQLIGLRCETPTVMIGAPIVFDSEKGEKKIGEVTSVCVSPSEGPIALGFVKTAQANVGMAVRVGVQTETGVSVAVISELPFGSVTRP